MRRSTRVRLTLLLTLAAWMMFVPSAQAYIDAGSIGIVFQAIVAGIAAAGTAVAMFWDRIKAFFTRSDTADQDTHEPEKV